MVFIYILELENNKFYIGKTNNPNFRIKSHFDSFGSEWTNIHKPLRLLELINNCDDYDEDKYTRIYMDKFGVENVRGGSFVSLNLSDETLRQIKRMSIGTNDKCFKCGEIGHFANACLESSTKILEIEKKSEIKDKACTCPSSYFSPHRKSKCFLNEVFNDKEKEKEKQTNINKKKLYECYRCGREGHFSPNCYASSHIDGHKL
jgi:hypothetical protein